MNSKLNFSKFVACLSIAAFIFGPLVLKAQDSKKKYEQAMSLINSDSNYRDALPILLELDATEKDNNNIKYQIGVCYFNAPIHQEKAIPYLQKACWNVSDKYNPG